MQKLFCKIRRQDGKTLSEYALILVLVAMVVIAAVTLLGDEITAVFNSIASSL